MRALLAIAAACLLACPVADAAPAAAGALATGRVRVLGWGFDRPVAVSSDGTRPRHRLDGLTGITVAGSQVWVTSDQGQSVTEFPSGFLIVR